MNALWKKIKQDPLVWVLAGILCVYFGAIALINFSGRPSFYNTDMYTDVLFSARAWEGKSLLPEGWLFGNQLYVVATPALATLLHLFTGDHLLTMAAAACIFSVLVAWGFDWMLRPVVADKTARAFGLVVFMTLPLFFGDSVGTENGWQLFFTMCAYYACYIFNVFLAFGCYIRSLEKTDRRLWMTVAVTCVISFCTGVQSLRQTAVMTVPLLGLTVLRLLWKLTRKESWKDAPLAVAGAVSVSNLLGYLSRSLIEFEQTEIFGELAVAEYTGFLPSLKASVLTMLDLLRCEEPGDYLVLCVLLLACVLAAVELVRKAGERGVCLLILLAFGVLAIGFVDVVTTIFVRQIYYFLLYPLLAFLMAYGFANRKKLVRWGILGLMVPLMLIPSMIALKDICMQAYFAKYDPYYEVSDYLVENGYTTLYSVWNHGEKVAVASDLQIEAGYWDTRGLAPVGYLCNPRVYEAEAEGCVYITEAAVFADALVSAAAELGVELTLLEYFPVSDTYLFTAPVNVMQIQQ